jgi:hypothetical protein
MTARQHEADSEHWHPLPQRGRPARRPRFTSCYTRSMGVAIFPEHCPNHGKRADRYWVEPTGEGYEHLYLLMVQYKCECLASRTVAQIPGDVQDAAGRSIRQTDPPTSAGEG